MKKIRLILISLLAIFFMASCSMVHEWPEEPGVDPTDVDVELKIKCKVDFSGNYVVSKAPMDLSQEVPEKYDRRYVIEVRNNEYNDNILKTITVIKEAQDTAEFSVNVKLQARKYKVVVWMDYILKGTNKDLYYLCDNGASMKAIHLPVASKYVAGTDFKDGQHALSEIDLTQYAQQWHAKVSFYIPLKRPVAKITFLSTDIEKYAESISYVGSLEDLAKTLKVEVSYNGYLPTGFNAVSGRLNDAEVGFGFQYQSSYPRLFEQKNYTIVGSDYVFVNSESSSVTVSAVIKDQNGKIVNEVNSIVVPIFKDVETIVTDKFFTKEYVPGIGISPEFDGEFNVYV